MRRITLVTGYSRGIGLAVSKHLSLDGHNFMVGLPSESECLPVLHQLCAQDSKVLHIQADVSFSEDRMRIVDQTLSVLVNNAGIAPKDRINLLE